MIITDGDPFSRGKYVAAGMARAATLARTQERRDELTDLTKKLIAAGSTADTSVARRAAARSGVFVGVETLEPDLVPLLANEMIAAHEELELSADLKTQFIAATMALQAGAGDQVHRDELLRRITSISKGRYAQRLADHVQGCDPALLLADLELTDDNEIEALDRRTSTERLLSSGSYGYILAALDRVSWKVRNHSILQVLTAPEQDTDARA